MPRPKRSRVQTARAAQRVALQPKSTNLSPRKPAGNRSDTKKRAPRTLQAANFNLQEIASQAQDQHASDDLLEQAANDDGENTEARASNSESPMGGYSSVVRDRSTNLVSKVTESFPTMQPSAPPSVSRVQATPSMLSLSNFKRRPRQPSILQMVQQRLALEDQGDVEDSSLLALGAPLSSSPTQQEQEEQSEPDPDSPVPIRTTSSRKRRAHPVEDGDLQRSQSPSRKFRRITRMTTSLSPARREDRTIQVPSSQRSKQAENQLNFRAVSHISSPAGGANSSEVAQSVEPHTPPSQRLGTRTRAQAGPPVDTHIDSRSPESTPSTSPSKPSPPKRTRNHPPKPQLPTTSVLQALLPKRRKRRFRTDEFEILDDEEESRLYSRKQAADSNDDDADELHRPSRRRIRGVGGKPKAKKPPQRGRKPLGKANDTNAMNSKNQKKRLSKVYGKSRLDQAEESSFSPGQGNSNEADDSLITSESAVEQREALRQAKESNELKKAAEKFKSVDEWELSFESQDVSGETSSSWR